MKKNAVRSSPLEWMLGRLGFVLIVLLSWACEQQTGPPRTLRTRVRGVLCTAGHRGGDRDWMGCRSHRTRHRWTSQRHPVNSTDPGASMTNRGTHRDTRITELARICPVAEPPTPSADPDVEALVNRARAAQRDIEAWSEARIEALLHALASAVAAHAYQLAVATVTETGMGNVRDKALKNSVASAGVCAAMAGQIGNGQIGFDRERQVAEMATPVGVVSAWCRQHTRWRPSSSRS